MNIQEKRITTAVLVIGTGGSGLRAAIELAERGVDVIAVGKRPKADAHTSLAAGGINAALATMDPEDTWQQHAADTIRESYLLANPLTVQIVAEGAERGIGDLERYGMNFAREENGAISQRFFGAHKFRRTAFAGDYTGLEIQRTLIRRAEQLRVPILDTIYITKLLVRENTIFGAYGFDLEDGTRYVIHADAVILAAGGHNRIWRRSSSRRDENTGDSFRLAVEAGGRIRDPELVQFHPSGIIEPESAAGTLVSEAARGEGGILRNARGERFMERYDAERMELSTRDRVALAAYTEIKEGRGTANGGVWLDVSHLPRKVIMERLPRVYQTLLDVQMLDITKDPIEIAPTAHYSMGGVWVRPEDHGTDVDGLYAIGEAASGLHGANRLGGNSLIELLVFGRIVGEAAAKYSNQLESQRRSLEAIVEARSEVDALLACQGSENVRALQRAVRDTMTEHAGVVRSEEGLIAGLEELDSTEDRLEHLGIHPDIAGFQDLAHAFDLKSSLLAARATLEAALERRESRGCHNRSDFPDQDESLQVNFVWSPGRLDREAIPPIPDEIAELMQDVSTAGKLVE
ncbi:Succinate dehydrogenase (plasmid) [Pseudarthrobacter chlorophenolicus A6]|uniref:L-aspartate oxidase n=1 Tax=Pseudarthrobacter chlorophenolicus (strain ATCC 700700 / DSM 12829 / CIP 107037 / JCM 12360 / KCTC 9906 / NCIMB 13794 / A6) TaxID=452863 RepID=B8HJD1_PSECP|nr:FAD-dependent oxidoreductase [Pseudarthrobacter chlorophenolicus]ACL42529.1 Succinate dehydrogenase [Pseudarthrobacter chlorophenolicus A6]SDQ10560.1 succinate dehydrogenase / fumarate reductase flavoprotein subunit [Pseudarthrobacter chlorophenolicus]